MRVQVPPGPPVGRYLDWQSPHSAALARREHYEPHRQKYINRARAWRDACRDVNRQLVLAHLADHPRVDCGETDVVVLDFDHRENKSFGIANMMQFARWARIAAEIAKCDVRCANCRTWLPTRNRRGSIPRRGSVGV